MPSSTVPILENACGTSRPARPVISVDINSADIEITTSTRNHAVTRSQRLQRRYPNTHQALITCWLGSGGITASLVLQQGNGDHISVFAHGESVETAIDAAFEEAEMHLNDFQSNVSKEEQAYDLEREAILLLA